MPIKFRCNYCRQFLGISRTRAGEVFDCPTCGRAIRVPELDGSVAPLPEPELDGADAHLARALSELAALVPGDQDLPRVARELSEPEAEIPQPLPEPVPVEIALPVMVTPVTPLMSGPASDKEGDAGAALQDVLRELSTLPAEEPAVETQNAPRFLTSAVAPPRGTWTSTLVTAIAALLGAMGGVWSVFAVSGPLTNEDVREPPVAPAVANADTVTVRGRVTYQADAGTIAPDVGACVIILPGTWDGAARLAPIGLRAADHAVDQAVAAAMVRAMGGAVVWTDAAGEYEVTLPRAGAHRVLVLSRLAAASNEPAATTGLEGYLADVPGTLGQRAYAWRDVVAQDQTENVWDQHFGVAVQGPVVKPAP